MNRKKHWENAWTSKQAEEVSWFQAEPEVSLRLIAHAADDGRCSLIDVGGGASRLVDRLLEQGFEDLAVLDISATALQRAQQRLGANADAVDWICADVTRYEPSRRYAVWHDRAAFHFLVEAADRRAYVETLRKALEPGGQVVIAAFALDGPSRCSGLDVVRYDGSSLAAELGEDFCLEESCDETHWTPAGKPQRFACFRFRQLV